MKAILELVAGILAGAAVTGAALLASGRPSTPEPPKAERPPSVLDHQAEAEQLRQECRELRGRIERAPAADPEKEIRDLQARIAALEKKPAPSDRARTVREFFAKMRQGGSNDMQEMLKVLKLVKQMDPTDSAFFADHYRQASNRLEQSLDFTLAFYGGGDPAAAFLKEWLKDGSVPPEVREEYLFSTASMMKGPGTTSMPGYKAFPVDLELHQTAMTMAESPKASERAGATFVLAFSADRGSRPVLLNLAQNDAEPRVRMAAVRALAVAGDRDTATILSSMPLPPAVDYSKLDYSNPEDLKKLYGAALREALTATLQELERRYPK